MSEIAYVNGSFMPLAEATVSVEDRGFQFADGVYETLVTRKGKPFLLDEHLQRLRRSAAGIALDIDDLIAGIPGVLAEGLARSGYEDALVYLQITRGAASRDHVYRFDLVPTVVATFKPRPVYDPAVYRDGVACVSTEDIRWRHCWVKSVALLPAVMMKNDARRGGFFDAIIVGPDGNVRESTAANVCMISGSTLKTPPLTDYILAGVTRAFVLQQAPRIGLQVEECELTLDDFKAADEMMLTSTTVDTLPVTRVDDHVIGSGQPGEFTAMLRACFADPR